MNSVGINQNRQFRVNWSDGRDCPRPPPCSMLEVGPQRW